MSGDDSIQERVQRGLNWLETEGRQLGLDPGRIDATTLDVSHDTRCPLAQSASDSDGDEYFDDVLYEAGKDAEWAVEHGFLPGATRGFLADAWTEEAGHLTDEWRRILTSAVYP